MSARGGRPPLGWSVTLSLFVASGLISGAAPPLLKAQEPGETRILTVVDYIAGTDLYLAMGTDHGVRMADTLPVYDGEEPGAFLLGRIVIVSATARRSVAHHLGTPFPLEAGEVLYVGVPGNRLSEAVEPTPGAVEPDRSVPEKPKEREVPRPPTLFHGRISLDYDALSTTTRWGEDPGGEEKRSFQTPTLRLYARGTNLPGGFDLNTNLRVSHRTSPDDIVRPVTSTRIYQMDLARRFERVPLEMHLGRFHSPFDEFSGFWDGLLLRVGPEALGAGIAAGFEPRWSNEGFSSSRPKALAFLDAEIKGRQVDYSGALSFLGIRPDDGLPDRTSMGLSQRVRFGRVWIRQRLEVDRSAEGTSWDLTRVQLDASLTLAGGMEAFGGWRRWRYLPLWTPGAEPGPRRDRGQVGLSWWGRSGGATVSYSLDRPESGDDGRTVTGSFHLSRTPIGGVGLGGTVSHWSRGDASSLLVSPELRASLGRLTLIGGYRFYRTDLGSSSLTTHFGDAGLTMPLGGGTSLRIRGSSQWGERLSSQRVFVSIWKGF